MQGFKGTLTDTNYTKKLKNLKSRVTAFCHNKAAWSVINECIYINVIKG